MTFSATKAPVKNRGEPPDEFLTELVGWFNASDPRLYMPNANNDIYSAVFDSLGPWKGLVHRTAAMMEVLRVLGGMESDWNWLEGVDTTNPTSDRPETEEAGLWQCSMNAIAFGQDLKDLTKAKIGTTAYSQGRKFQRATKADHAFAMEFVVRLLRHTIRHHGPLLRSGDNSVYPWLSRKSVAEFASFIEVA